MHIAHLHIAHLHIAHQSNQHISTLADLGKVCKILQFFSKIEFFLGLDTAENEPCKDLQKVCKILQDLQKVCKILQDLQIFLQKFRQNFWQTLNFSRIFFGIFKKCLEFFATDESPLPNDGAERPRRHSQYAPTSTSPRLQATTKSARVATSSVEIDQKSKFDFFF